MVRTAMVRAAVTAALIFPLAAPAVAQPGDEALTVSYDFIGIGDAPEPGDSTVTVIGDAQGNYEVLWASDLEGLDEPPLFVGGLSHTQTIEAHNLIASYTNSEWWACSTTAGRPRILTGRFAWSKVSQTCTGTLIKQHRLRGELQQEEGIGFWEAQDEVDSYWRTSRTISRSLLAYCDNEDPTRWRTWAQGRVRIYNDSIQGYEEKYLRTKRSSKVWGDCEA